MDASYTTSEAPVNEIEAEKYRNVTIDKRKGGNCVTRNTVSFWAFFPAFLLQDVLEDLYILLFNVVSMRLDLVLEYFFFGFCNWGVVRSSFY